MLAKFQKTDCIPAGEVYPKDRLFNTKMGTVCKAHCFHVSANRSLDELGLPDVGEDCVKIHQLVQQAFQPYEPCLKKLELQSRNIKSLPADFLTQFRNLRSVSFTNMPFLEAIPESIGSLTYLR